MILRPHGRPFNKIDIENEAFAQKIECWNPAGWQSTENFETVRKKIRFRDKFVEIHENMIFIYFFKPKH